MSNKTKSWIQAGIGFWILISPWLLGFAEVALAKWSNVGFGLILVVMSIWEIFGEEKE
jgi:membrane protein YdbS with pleckstrin-like domain